MTLKDKFKSGLITILLPLIGSLEKEQLIALLEKFNTESPEDCKATVQALHPGLKRLMHFAEQTNTEIDDTLTGSAIEALEVFAKGHDIDLAI